MMQLPEIGLYVHFPWCMKKCYYCDFNSHLIQLEDSKEEYIDALIIDLQQELKQIEKRPIKSIFFGGGTPSLMSPDVIDKLLSNFREKLCIMDDCEVTLESNPGSVERGRFYDYFQAGINRISLGIQSFNDDQLKILGRIHDGKQAMQAVEEIKKAGFVNFNLDLMFALPNQTLAQAKYDVITALSLEPTHLSHYQLTIEPNTVFYSKTPSCIPGDEKSWQMQNECKDLLLNKGYEHYEISAYAKPSQQCVHNLNYWLFGDYCGIGAGAHSKLLAIDSHEYFRYHKANLPRTYLKNIQNGNRRLGFKKLDQSELVFEFMLNHLRLFKPIDESHFFMKTNLSFDDIDAKITNAENQGLLMKKKGQLIKTRLGDRFLNDLQTLFL